jgi:hypothetical protein
MRTSSGACAAGQHRAGLDHLAYERVVERLRRSGSRIEDAWLRRERIGPAHFGHINFRGTMRFGIEQYAQLLINGQDQPVRQLRLV